MIKFTRLKGYFWRPNTLALVYAFTVLLLSLLTTASLADIIHRYIERNSSLALLETFRARAHTPSKNGSATEPDLLFLSGGSATIANAVLLQRVTGAITSSHGRVLSSEVSEKSAQAKDRELITTITFQIGQINLQKLLYDLESGVPFLFVNQLDIQSKELADSATPRLHVVMKVSGIWRGPK